MTRAGDNRPTIKTMKTKLILASLLLSNLIACAARSSKGSLVAHEWGTFTSVQEALVSEGLYEREATAMVKTWEDSWFGEQGLRVLYVLPRAWTDRTLPLSIEPKPKEIVRVMVGRAEM